LARTHGSKCQSDKNNKCCNFHCLYLGSNFLYTSGSEVSLSHLGTGLSSAPPAARASPQSKQVKHPAPPKKRRPPLSRAPAKLRGRSCSTRPFGPDRSASNQRCFYLHRNAPTTQDFFSEGRTFFLFPEGRTFFLFARQQIWRRAPFFRLRPSFISPNLI
jgi:hypothetical protein